MPLDLREPLGPSSSKWSIAAFLPRSPLADAGDRLQGWGRLQALALRAQALAPYRFFTRSLARRIFVSNLLGMLVLLFGILWLSHNHDWLIAAKRESLRVQGEIVAAAIAASASLDTDRITFEPERLTETPVTKFPFRDDAFAAFELSLRPDKVGPVLRRLIQTSHNTRARIYDRDGELIVDTSQVGTGVQNRPDPSQRIRTKTPWTRILSYIDSSDLPLYREIGAANGNAYSEVRQALQGRSPQPMLLIDEGGEQIVSLAIPILRRNATLGALLLSTRPGEVDEILVKERWIILTLAAMAFLTTLMASSLLTRTIAGPVHRLSAAAEQVSQSINARAELPDYSQRPDEVGQLSEAVRRMTEALYRRIEAADTFAADVAHELKNPLAAVRVMAETLVTYAKTPEQRDHLIREIQVELERLNRLITEVSEASRLEADIERQTNTLFDVVTVLRNVVEVLSDLHAPRNRTISLEVESRFGEASSLMISGHSGRIARVITNLLDNALSFSPEGGRVRLAARLVGSEIEISVEDGGPGIPEDKLEDVFTRFYSDRPDSDQVTGKNSGLGLSISRLIVNGHGGRIWAENRYRSAGEVIGARFVVRLPARGSTGLGRRI